MTTEQLKNWIKAQDPDYAGRIQLGGVDGNAERFLGVYPSPDQGPAHIAIGGPACTSYGTLSAGCCSGGATASRRQRPKQTPCGACSTG